MILLMIASFLYENIDRNDSLILLLLLSLSLSSLSIFSLDISSIDIHHSLLSHFPLHYLECPVVRDWPE